jgi:DNA-binding response OmpR family regulator
VAVLQLLVVESDPALRGLLSHRLERAGFDVRPVSDAASAIAAVSRAPDALLIDLDLPDRDGRDLARALRMRGVDRPALFLVPPDVAADEVMYPGAHDCVTKPVNHDEVVARLRALLRSSGGAAAIAVGTVAIDPVMHTLSGENGAVPLSPTEFRVLAALAGRRGALVLRRDLVRAGWPAGAVVHDNTLDQYVARLRRKLRTVTSGMKIVTLRSVGYRLE